MNKAVILFLCFLTFSCSGSYKRGNELTKLLQEHKSDLQIGALSKSDVVARYSHPNHQWNDKFGNVVYNYQYLEIRPFFHTYIPLVSIFIRPSEKISTYDISITFDRKNGKVIDTSFFFEERDY